MRKPWKQHPPTLCQSCKVLDPWVLNILITDWPIFVPSRPRPPAENAWWFDLSFLSQTPFLVWNVRWAIKLQNAQLQVIHHWSAKWPPQFLFRDLHFLCERESSMYQHSVLLKTGPQLTYCRTSFSGLQVRVSEVVLHSQTLTGRSLAMWDYFTSDTLHS